jgi:hypothetical protein
MSELRSAIPPDELLDRPLGELSAADFLAALSHPKLDQRIVSFLPEKKKYELWIEEGWLPRLNIRELLDRLRGEKKKLELEKSPYEHIVKYPHEHIKRLPEGMIDPHELLRDPAFIDEIAAQVAARLRHG